MTYSGTVLDQENDLIHLIQEPQTKKLINVNKFRQGDQTSNPIDLSLTVLDVDEAIFRSRSELMSVRDAITKKPVAPIGAFIYKKKVQKPSGKIYEYWFVQGYNPEKKTLDKSLGTTKKQGKKLEDYKSRIARRDQLHAIDTRLDKLQAYINASNLSVFSPIDETEGEDGS